MLLMLSIIYNKGLKLSILLVYARNGFCNNKLYFSFLKTSLGYQAK